MIQKFSLFPSRTNRHPHRRGYLMIEMLIIIALLPIFALLAGHLFVSIFKILQTSGKADEQAMRFDAAVAQLRQDISTAASTETPTPATLLIQEPNRETIQWQTNGPPTTLTRIAQADKRTYEIGKPFTFRKDGVITLIHPGNAPDNTADISFASTSKPQ